MPLPAIIAGIARAGASLFASQAGRTAATAAATGAARAAPAAVGAGAAPVGRGLAAAATKAPPVAPSGFANAAANPQATTQAIRMPPQPGPRPPANNLPGKAEPPTGKGWSQTLQKAPAPGSEVADHAAAQAKPFTRPQAPSRPPPKESFVERATKTVKDLHRKVQDVRSGSYDFMRPKPQKSVADETRGMTLDQRYQRLQKSGSLLNASGGIGAGGPGGGRGGTNGSIGDAVRSSERAEQRQRELSNKAQQDRGQAQIEGVKKAVKTGGMLGGATGAALAAFNPITILKALDGIEKWSAGLLESRRDLAKFDHGIANVFARLDRQQLQISMRRAQATSGTTQALGQSIGQLRRELEPLFNASASTVNLLATAVVQGAQIVAFFTKISPVIQVWMRTMGLIEDYIGKPQTGSAHAEFWAKTARADFKRPSNFRPGPDEF